MYQYYLFKHAKILICQHGAAMANIIFMNPGCGVIEIIPEKKIRDEKEDSFINLGKLCKLNYHLIETVDEMPIIDIDNIITNIDKLLIMTK
jgi:capsular polysaccharide biosynthesis protein